MCDNCVEWGGKRWHRYASGYYERTDKRLRPRTRRLHREVWAHHHGPIPPGHDVHHRDEDRGNNEICNLELLSHAQHKRHHYKPIPQPDWSQRPTHVVPCADCGRPLERKRPGALARCSKCHSRRAEEQRKYERECRHCGAGFRSRAGNFCSQRCVNLATNGATTRVLPEG